MKNSNSTPLERGELELLLADYATDLLDKGLAERVSDSLKAYPDLQHEADELRGAFSLVNRDERNAAIDFETRNLSVYVVNALGAQKRTRFRYLGWLAPAAVVAILLVMVNVNGWKDTSIETVVPTKLGSPVARVAAPTPPADTMVETAPKLTDTAVTPKQLRTAPRRTTQPLTREEIILDDLVSDQIVDRIASDVPDASEADAFTITDDEIDVLLAAVTSNETL
jgi:hypothetical protein